jgi:hypothetical protein
MPNLLFRITNAPDCLRMVVAFIELHDIAKIRRACKALRHAIPGYLLLLCMQETEAKYSRVVRIGDSLRMYSQFGRKTYDIRPMPMLDVFFRYCIESPMGLLECWLHPLEKNPFCAKTIHITDLRIWEDTISVCVRAEFDDGPIDVPLHFFLLREHAPLE